MSVALAACFVLGALGGHSTAAQRAAAGKTPDNFSFPRDDGAHPGSRLEWWRLFGHLHAGKRRFDFTVIFFRFAIPPNSRGSRAKNSRWLRPNLYPAAFGFVDEARRRFVSATVFDRQALGFG